MTSGNQRLKEKVVLVTGASRGIGRGIALQLGEAGATVYVTGRKKGSSANAQTNQPTLEGTANEISARGGKGIFVYCDHEDDKQVEALFERIAKEQNGQLDILVNNAYAGVPAIFGAGNKKFFELPLSIYDTINNTGLRNHYVCAVFAARLMVPRRQGLIVTVSSFGGLAYLFNVAYGLGKAACDKMASDISHELREYNITSVSLCPGPVKTEFIQQHVLSADNNPTKKVFENGESTEFPGKCIVELAADPNKLALSGRILSTSMLGSKYEIGEGLESHKEHSIFENIVDVINEFRLKAKV